MRRSGGGDRIILFTLVDLLLQIIFLGLFLFAAHRAFQGDVDDRVTKLIAKFGVVPVGQYLNATSKLVAIADLDRIAVIPAGKPKETQALKDTTKLLRDLDRGTVRGLANMDRSQLKTLAAMVKKPEFRRLLSGLATLPRKEQGAFVDLGGAFLKADPDTRTKIIAAAANVKPLCFAKRNAYHIVEIPGGYVVRPLIRDVRPDIDRALPGHRGAQQMTLSEAEFSRLGDVTNAIHRNCTVNVTQESQTNNERQFKTIQHYFGTW